MVRYLPEMHVPRDDFVNSENNAFDVISVYTVLLVVLLIRISNASSEIKVKDKQLVCLFVHQKVSWGYVLMLDTVLEIEIINSTEKLLQPFELEDSRRVFFNCASWYIDTCKSDDNFPTLKLIYNKPVERNDERV